MPATRTLTLSVTALALAATTVGAVATQAAPSAPRATQQPVPVREHFTGSGFDKCLAPPTADMRSWSDSPYHAVNIYFGGVNRACDHQPELDNGRGAQWVSTVTSNGWALIPTYVGMQSMCQSAKQQRFNESNAAANGTANADDAVSELQTLGLGAGTPVYFDMEPFNTSNDSCRRAAITFMNAWTTEIHAKGYRSGLYAHPTMGLKPLVTKTDPQPDDVWWPRYDGDPSTTSEPALPVGSFPHHRIHQYVGNSTESQHGVKFTIDRDSIDADVIGAVNPSRPSGPPYVYVASPPADSDVIERTTPTTNGDNTTGVTYAYGTAVPIACQAAGQTIDGSYVWDRLTDGDYVSDINLTTTGLLSFTAGIPRCDTLPPTTTLNPTRIATTAAGYTFSWSALDAAPSGQRTSGIGSYDVRYRRAPYNAGFSGWTHIDDITATSTRVPLDPGFEYCMQVRATDRSFNTGHWSNLECITRPLDDRSLSLDTSGWTQRTSSRFYFHTVTQTDRKHRMLTLRGGRMRAVGLVASRCRSCGKVAVYVGSVKPSHLVGTVNLQGRRHDRMVWMLPAFHYKRAAVHLVTTKHRRVFVDGIVIARR